MSLHRDRRSREYGLEMTPMIDVTFLLLIFFLCTLNFRTFEGKLAAYLPEDGGSASGEPVERLLVTVDVAREGRRVDPADPTRPWDGAGRFELVDRVLAYRVGPYATRELARVRERLSAIRHDGDRPLILAPGRGTLHGDVVPVLDTIIEAGFSDVSLGESRRNP